MTAPVSLVRWAGVCTLAALLGSCASVVPQPGGRPAPPPPPPPPSAPVQPMGWDARPLTPGNWSYAREGGGSVARYTGTSGLPLLWLRCEGGGRAVSLAVAGTAAGDGSAMMTVRTSYGTLTWPARAEGGALPATVATRAASDNGLDWIAFSRGRVAVELPGLPLLVVPTWAEPARVIEDCRG